MAEISFAVTAMAIATIIAANTATTATTDNAANTTDCAPISVSISAVNAVPMSTAADSPLPTQPDTLVPAPASFTDDGPMPWPSHVELNMASSVAPLIGLLADDDPSLLATLQYTPAAPCWPFDVVPWKVHSLPPNMASSVAPLIGLLADDDPSLLATLQYIPAAPRWPFDAGPWRVHSPPPVSLVSTIVPPNCSPMDDYLVLSTLPTIFTSRLPPFSPPKNPTTDSLHCKQHRKKYKVFNAHRHWTHLDVHRYMGLFDCPPDNPSPLCIRSYIPSILIRGMGECVKAQLISTVSLRTQYRLNRHPRAARTC